VWAAKREFLDHQKSDHALLVAHYNLLAEE